MYSKGLHVCLTIFTTLLKISFKHVSTFIEFLPLATKLVETLRRKGAFPEISIHKNIQTVTKM